MDPRLPKEAGPSIHGKRFFTVAEAAELLGLSEPTVYRAIHAGEFPAIKVRGRAQHACPLRPGARVRRSPAAGILLRLISEPGRGLGRSPEVFRSRSARLTARRRTPLERR
jgi:excisionase family DNA binding protein